MEGEILGRSAKQVNKVEWANPTGTTDRAVVSVEDL
jgi:hypothetical protein